MKAIKGKYLLIVCSAALMGAWQFYNPALYSKENNGVKKPALLPNLTAKFAIAVNQHQNSSFSPLSAQDSIQTGNPQIILDEDFTDGAFDNLNAINPDPRRPNNWTKFGSTVAFRPAQGRNTFPVAFARKPALGGNDWEGLQFQVFQDKNGDNIYSTDEKKKWYVDKKDEVCIVEYTSFSDIASKPELYGTEVAMLEDVDDAAFQGNPHYGHDLSFEVLQVHTVDRTQPSVQLEPNVENVGNRSNVGVLKAHYDGYATDALLGKEYTQTTIWRNVPNSGKTNCEQWGQYRYGDMFVPSEMNSDREPTNRYSVFNNIQVSLFRAGIRTNQPVLVRAGIAARDSAQVGITKCKVGITKKCDFDLSYSVGPSDLAILTSNLGRTDSANIRTGDADNNTKVDANDANSVIGLWNENKPVFDSVKTFATYNPATGHILLTLKNISYLKISSLNSRLNRNAVNVSGLNAVGQLISDSAIILYTGGEWNVSQLDLGPAAATALQTGELSLRVNYKASGESEGFLVPFSNQFVTNLPNLAQNRQLNIDGHRFNFNAEAEPIIISVYTIDGKLLYHNDKVKATTTIDLSSVQLSNVPKVVFITNSNRKRIFSQVYTSF